MDCSQEIISSSAPDNFSTMDNTFPPSLNCPVCKEKHDHLLSRSLRRETVCVCVCVWVCVCACACTRFQAVKEKKHIDYFLKFCKKISKVLLTNALELTCFPYESESEVSQLCLAL